MVSRASGIRSRAPRLRRLVTAGSINGTGRVWDTATWAPISREIPLNGGAALLAFAPDGRHILAICSRDHFGRAEAWNADTGERVVARLGSFSAGYSCF